MYLILGTSEIAILKIQIKFKYYFWCRDSFAQLIANLEEIRKRYVDLPVRKQM